MKFVLDERIPFLPEALEPLGEVVRISGSAIRKEHLHNADALFVRTRTFCNAELLQDTSVKFVGTTTVGTDHLDIPWLEQNNIHWASAPGCNAAGVVQYVLSVLMLHCHQHAQKPQDIKLGLIGVGQVGSRLCNAARKIGFQVLLCDPPRARFEGTAQGNHQGQAEAKNAESFLSHEELIAQSDIISFHVPLTFEGENPTWHLLQEKWLDHRSAPLYLINTSRGPVVEEQLLLKAVQNKHIIPLALDVWEFEPQITPELLEQTLITTPHIAGYTLEGKWRGAWMVWESFVSQCSSLFSGTVSEASPSATLSPPNTPTPIDVYKFPQLPRLAPTLPLAPDVPSVPLSAEQWFELLLSYYDPRRDSQVLKSHPEHFERLRSEYDFRREYPEWLQTIMD